MQIVRLWDIGCCVLQYASWIPGVFSWVAYRNMSLLNFLHCLFALRGFGLWWPIAGFLTLIFLHCTLETLVVQLPVWLCHRTWCGSVLAAIAKSILAWRAPLPSFPHALTGISRMTPCQGRSTGFGLYVDDRQKETHSWTTISPAAFFKSALPTPAWVNPVSAMSKSWNLLF